MVLSQNLPWFRDQKKPCSAQSVVTSSGTFIHWGWHTTQRDWRSSKHSYIFTMCGCSSLNVEPWPDEHRMNMMNHLIAEVSWVIILIGHKLNASHGQVLENASFGLPLQKVKYTGRELLVLPLSIYPYVYIYMYTVTDRIMEKKRFNLQAPPVYDRKVTNFFFLHNYCFHIFFPQFCRWLYVHRFAIWMHFKGEYWIIENMCLKIWYMPLSLPLIYIISCDVRNLNAF